ncbi:hypothetical protein RRG08_001621 [Elysia crispata]|uniref:Uncharacterized protein n=1 Tax=Elysia crispata TaxID=231223 RepID=A0AAE1ALA1_9GAST|nr:hypothetical protein RRG08_001621 [Elysia crispata]
MRIHCVHRTHVPADVSRKTHPPRSVGHRVGCPHATPQACRRSKQLEVPSISRLALIAGTQRVELIYSSKHCACAPEHARFPSVAWIAIYDAMSQGCSMQFNSSSCGHTAVPAALDMLISTSSTRTGGDRGSHKDAILINSRFLYKRSFPALERSSRPLDARPGIGEAL